MKKEDYEKLGTLEKMIYDYLLKAWYENNYTINLEEFRYQRDGYVTATLMFDGCEIRCSINRGGYIAWHTGELIEKLMRELPHVKVKLIAQANRIIKENEAAYKQQRICELEKELAELKSA